MLYERLKKDSLGVFGKTWPALAVLILTSALSLFSEALVPAVGMKAVWFVLLRFLRMTILLLVPVFLMPHMCKALRNRLRKGSELIYVEQDNSRSALTFKIWVLRPLQGIGLTMLVATKLILLLEIYSGDPAVSSSMFASGAFNVWRFWFTTVIILFISMLLSFLWGIDDLGIRLYKEKTGEVTMIGRYVGLFLPVVFGFYGIHNLLLHYPQIMAARFVLHIVMIMYAPFLIFIVFHMLYIEKRRTDLLEILKPRSGNEFYSFRQS